MSLLESTILIIVFTLIGLFSLFLAVIGYSLISGLITVSLIISVAYIISKDY